MKNLFFTLFIFSFFLNSSIAQVLLDETGSTILRNSSITNQWSGKTKLTLGATAAQYSGFELSYNADISPRVGRITLNNNWGGIYGDFAISLRNGPTSSDIPERFRIKYNGNVGIGTINPLARLEIDNVLKDNIGLRITKSFNGGGEGIPLSEFLFSDRGITDAGIRIGIKESGGNFDIFNAYYNGEIFTIKQNGRVGIGIPNPDSKLVVDGTIKAEEIKVAIVGGADYVFSGDYELKTLKETKKFIELNKHLPEIPSAKEMEEKGISLGDMNILLLKKIEELTLYQISLLEKIESQNVRLKELEDSAVRK